jgi:1,4-dihydroxy-2-naphthoate octaprenyltransferase
MTFNLLLLNEFPDTEADRVGKRRHLVILLGPKRAGWVYAIAALSVPCVIASAVAVEAFPHAALLAVAPVLLLAPVAHWLHVGADQPVPRAALAMNVVWNLSTNLLLAVVFFFYA